MSGNPAARPIRVPPTDFEKQALPRTRQFPREWFRLHPTVHKAIFFSLNPTHRYSHPKCPSKMLYVGIDADTCLWERFGDLVFDGGRVVSKAIWNSTSISTIDIPHLHLCDLATTSTRGAMEVDLSALMHNDISIPQQWGLAIQQHPANVPAIKFKSRFTDKACLAIFERAGLPLKERSLGPLSSFSPALDWLAKNKVSLV